MQGLRHETVVENGVEIRYAIAFPLHLESASPLCHKRAREHWPNATFRPAQNSVTECVLCQNGQCRQTFIESYSLDEYKRAILHHLPDEN